VGNDGNRAVSATQPAAFELGGNVTRAGLRCETGHRVKTWAEAYWFEAGFRVNICNEGVTTGTADCQWVLYLEMGASIGSMMEVLSVAQHCQPTRQILDAPSPNPSA
jgi:hypothetical protein